MASGTVLVIPANGANIQTAQGFPSVLVQSSGAIQYGGQQSGISNSAPQPLPQSRPLEKFLKVEAKTLGAIQIMIGLIHIGFGAITLCLFPSGYLTLAAIGGYPFWGGIFFISSGSLCVAAEKNLTYTLVKCSVGMNITSAIIALTGIMLYISELAVNRLGFHYGYAYESYMTKNVGIGFSWLLLLFSCLEFCIAVSLAHYGCQASCCADDQPTMVFVPYQVTGNAAIPTEVHPPSPPDYNNVVTKT